MTSNPKQAVQKQIGELLVRKLQNGELLPEEEAQLSTIRSSVHQRMLKYSAIGMIAGILVATPFKNRAKARLIAGSIGTMAAIQYAWHTSTDPALKALLSMSTPIGRDIRQIFKRNWPESPLLVDLKLQDHSISDGWSASDEDEIRLIPEEMIENIATVDPSQYQTRTQPRNQWGDIIEEDKDN